MSLLADVSHPPHRLELLLRRFVDQGWWWKIFGLVLLTCQVYILLALAVPPSPLFWWYDHDNNNNNDNPQQQETTETYRDGFWTVFVVGRGCALANFVAFWSFGRQYPGLIGTQYGLIPVDKTVGQVQSTLMRQWNRRRRRRQSFTTTTTTSNSSQHVHDPPVATTTTPTTTAAPYVPSLGRQWNIILENTSWWTQCFLPFPTLFWWVPPNDRSLYWICRGGCILSILLFGLPVIIIIMGFPLSSSSSTGWTVLIQQGLEVSCWWLCGWFYLSLKHVADDFLGLQSDANVVEIDALLGLTCCIIPRNTHPLPVLMVLRFFAFRKMLGCGICKWYGSPMWQEGTAMQVHYFTQPLPNRFSYYAHTYLPIWCHRWSVNTTFVIEILLPYLIWVPRLRYIAWIGFNALNLAINTTGNYGFIGFLNTAENLSITDDWLWETCLIPYIKAGIVTAWSIPVPEGSLVSSLHLSTWPSEWFSSCSVGIPTLEMLPFSIDIPSWLVMIMGSLWRIAIGIILVIYMAVSSLPTLSRACKNRYSALQLVELLPLTEDQQERVVCTINKWYKMQRPLLLCNYQGKFAGMHDYRWEPIIEGSHDGVTWHPYEWKYKQNESTTCGRVLPFHLPRLDWRVWFLPLYARHGQEPPDWYYALLKALLYQHPPVVDLLHKDPFQGGVPPKYIRSRLEEFVFAPPGDDHWWTTTPVRFETPLDIVLERDNDESSPCNKKED